MFEIAVEHTFPAGHWLRDYEGKCANPHGHNYRVQVLIRGPRLNRSGLLMDFGDVKKVLRGLCDRLDHQMLNEITPFDVLNPSAENIAYYLYCELSAALDPLGAPNDAAVAEVRIFETETALAAYRPL